MNIVTIESPGISRYRGSGWRRWLTLGLLSSIIWACSTQSEEEKQLESAIPSNQKSPLSLAIVIDVTHSGPEHDVPPTVRADIQPARDFVLDNGGQLMVIFACADSDRSGVYLFMDVPTFPPKPSEEGKNPYTLAKEKKQYRQKLRQAVKQYKSSQESARAKFDKELNDLFDRVTTLDASSTDLSNALLRADAFHKRAAGAMPKLTFLISDGIETRKQPVGKPTSNMSVVLVSGSNSPTGNWTTIFGYTREPSLDAAYLSHGIR